jgi:hypothetical protein
MPTLTDRVRTFLHSPQGRRLARQAQDKLSKPDARFARSPRGQRLLQRVQDYAARPENQRRLAQLRERLAARRRTQGR